jgi:hypothetical protein
MTRDQPNFRHLPESSPTLNMLMVDQTVCPIGWRKVHGNCDDGFLKKHVQTKPISIINFLNPDSFDGQDETQSLVD